MFYLPKIETEEIKRLEELIQRWGGIIVDMHEATSLQIRPSIAHGGLSASEFYSGNVYSSDWIEESILAGMLLKDLNTNYLLTRLDRDSGVKQTILSARKRFTIIEGIVMYNKLGSQKLNKLQPQFWKSLYENEILPGRSIDAMRNFWKDYSDVPLEEFLIEAFKTGKDYCLTYKKVPDPLIEDNFMQINAFRVQEWEARRANGEIG